MYDIDVSLKAAEDLQRFRKFEQVRIREEMDRHLRDEPDLGSGKRKRLEPGHVADWELRVGNIRVFYDVDNDASVVSIVRIGYKERNRLFLGGQEYPL